MVQENMVQVLGLGVRVVLHGGGGGTHFDITHWGEQTASDIV